MSDTYIDEHGAVRVSKDFKAGDAIVMPIEHWERVLRNGQREGKMPTIDDLVDKRIADEYEKYYNPKTEKYEIEVGTKAEWICTHEELKDDVRRSIEEDIA